jgi:hypothetical protein
MYPDRQETRDTMHGHGEAIEEGAFKKRVKALRKWFTGQQRDISVEKGQKLCPAHHRSMESPGKYSLYPQRPRNVVQTSTCVVLLDRTVVP